MRPPPITLSWRMGEVSRPMLRSTRAVSVGVPMA